MNKAFHPIIIAFATLTGVTPAIAKTPDLPTPLLTTEIAVAQEFDFGRHFKKLGVKGSIIIYDRNTKRLHQHNIKRNVTRFPAASTFKIPNSLISLETKVIPDEKAIINWDGNFREVDDWNQDLNMKDAFKFSAVWFYQTLARRVGYERMQEWVKKAKYGNQKIGTKAQIDRFWLNGTLRISPREQILFLQRLYENDLPFSKRSLSIVKDIMVEEKKPNYTIRSKTGWFGFGTKTKPQIGWYVGYLEQNKNVYFFATNIDIRQEKDAARRKELTYRCLKDMGLL
jgi:beta-lactamase class D